MSSIKIHPLIIKLFGNIFYPINKTVIFYDAEDHSNYLGFNWERVSIGRFPVGLNLNDTDFNTVGKKGGNKKSSIVPDGLRNCGNGEDWHYQGIDVDNRQLDILPPYEVMAFWRRIA